MSRFPWHRRYHSDFLIGVSKLTPEQRGVYNTLCDLMYERRGPLLNDEFYLAHQNNCSPIVFRRIRDELQEAGKILVAGGLISNPRVMKELGAAGHIDCGPTPEAGANFETKQERAVEKRAKNAERVRRHRAQKRVLHSLCTRDVTHPVTPLQSAGNAEKDREPGLFGSSECNAASSTISRIEESLPSESVATGTRTETPEPACAPPLAAGQRRRAALSDEEKQARVARRQAALDALRPPASAEIIDLTEMRKQGASEA